MNLCFSRRAIPLMYFPLMGQGQPDALGWSFSVGEPFVRHARASDPFVNLVKEAPGIKANETFWEDIDAAPARIWTDAVGTLSEYCLGRLGWHMQQLGKALAAWKALLHNDSLGF